MEDLMLTPRPREVIRPVVLALTLVASAETAFAHGAPPPGQGVSASVRANAEQLTLALVKLNVGYQAAAAAQRAVMESQMRQLAVMRAQAVTALLEDDPAEFLRVALPGAVRARMPASVQAQIEEEADVEGELEVLHEDGVGGSRYHHVVHATSGKVTLKFVADAPDLPTGTRVRIHGTRLGQLLAVGGGGSTQVLAAAGSSTFGAQKTLVILVNFTDNPTQPYTVADAKSVVFTTTSNFHLENSYGQTWLTGDVAGWYTIPLSGTGCDYSSISAYAEQAASAAGVSVSSYPRRVYAFPSNGCGWWGLGSVGGNPSRAWINGSLQLRVLSHEMGHNLGLYHSHSLDCGDVVLGGNCTLSDYGDTFDTMGASPNHYNAFQKERLGWLNAGSSPGITTVTNTGTYTIDPMETLGGVKALKILQDGPSNTYYYVEFRQPIGFDAAVAAYPNVVNGVLLHTGSPWNGDSSLLLDMTPNTSSWYDPALAAGTSYVDGATGITIAAVSANSTNASVMVSFGAMQCVKAAPGVAVSPSQSQWVQAGSTVRYTVSVKNNDNSGCTSSTFTVGASVPAGWPVVYGGSPVAVAPGATGTVTVDVTSATSATDGFYTIGVTATDAADGTRAATGSATYVIPSALSVSVASDQASYQRNQVVVLTTTVLNNGAPVSGASITVTLKRPNGSTTTMSATTGATGAAVVKYRIKKQDPTGIYQASSSVSLSGTANGSASTSFAVQ